MNVSVKLDLEKLTHDKNDDLNMMVSIAAPDVSKESKRNPLCVCAVIDRSGSMRGQKLDFVKKSVYKMIDHMTEDDSLSLVFFDDAIETVPFKRMSSANKEVMKQEVAKVDSRNSTDLGSALIAASRLFSSYEGDVKAVERIMLLTDGQANIGASIMAEFEPIVSKIRKGVTVSTFGYGNGFNEDLLGGISKQGQGNNYFIETPDNVSKVFAVELGGLLTCFAQDIVVSVKAHKGTSITNVLNDMDVTTRQDAEGELITDVKVGDIYAGERRDILVKMAFEKRPQALPRPITVADVSVSYRRMSDASAQSNEAKAKVELVKTASEATKERDKEIVEQVAILEAASVIIKAKELADSGNWMGAQSLFRTAAVSLRSVGSEKTMCFASAMDGFHDSLNSSYHAGDTLSKGFAYTSAAASTRGVSAVGYEGVKDALTAPVMNSVMSQLVSDFSGDSVIQVGTTTGATDKSSETGAADKKPTGYTKSRKSV